MNDQSSPNTSADPSFGLTRLVPGVAREAEALDASLDRAFGAIRTIRAAAAKATAPAVAAAATVSKRAGTPDDLFQDTTESLCQAATNLYEVVDQFGLQGAAESAARQVIDALTNAGSTLPEELTSFENVATPTPDTEARLLSELQAAAQTLQRRMSAPVGKLMSIMQLRDNMDQRCSHIIAGIQLAATSELDSRDLVEICLAAQMHDMANNVRDGGAASQKSAETIANLASGAMSEMSMILCRICAPRTAASMDIAREAMAQLGATHPGAARVADDYSEDARRAWNDLAATVAMTWSEGNAAQSALANKLCDLLRIADTLSQASNDVSAEGQRLAELALNFDSLADSMQQALSRKTAEDPASDPALQALWNCYTVDAEREVHAHLMQRLAS